MRWLWKAAQVVLRVGATAFFRMRVDGRDRLPVAGGVILAANHQSYLDPILVGIPLKREIHFMARRSLFRNPVFRALIVALNAFPIEREGGDVKGVKEALKRLKAGEVLVVFPEGTRTRNGKLGRIREGITFLAASADVPILPVLIDGAWKVWPPGRLLPAPGLVRVTYGRPFTVDRNGDRADATREILRQFEEMFARINAPRS